MSLKRRRSDRPDPARRRLGSSLEALESRQLLSGTATRFYQPQPYLPTTAVATHVPAQAPYHPIGLPDSILTKIGNDGKVVTGQDRQGNQYSIVVHGPGAVIVTDATPNDGVLDDDIDTIHLIGTDPNLTYVTGQTIASGRTVTNGEVRFNKLIAENGVASIVLNGFVLAQTVAPINGGLPNSNTGVFLPGGARVLQFTGVEGSFDTSANAVPINIIDGDPANPLPYRPSVKIDEISNTVFDSTTTIAPTTPQTTPTINIAINAESNSLEFVSATQQPDIAAGQQYLFPIVGTTGRTAVLTKGINTLRFTGSAVNVTASQSTTPFQGSFTGLSHVGTADFGGTADALGLDVNGKIGNLRFTRGLGNPTGTSTAATSYGIPAAELGFPANGLVGGIVRAGSIDTIVAAPANVTLLTSADPALIQQFRNGSTTYYPRAGQTLSTAGIVTSGSIGTANIVGDSRSSEIKTGFDLVSYNAGLEGTRGTSHIGRIRYRGDLVDSVISSSYRPAATGYGTPGSVAGPGTIAGHFNGSTYLTGQTTALGNTGAGFYARTKIGYLPPPQSPTRVNGVLIR